MDGRRLGTRSHIGSYNVRKMHGPAGCYRGEQGFDDVGLAAGSAPETIRERKNAVASTLLAEGRPAAAREPSRVGGDKAPEGTGIRPGSGRRWMRARPPGPRAGPRPGCRAPGTTAPRSCRTAGCGSPGGRRIPAISRVRADRGADE